MRLEVFQKRATLPEKFVAQIVRFVVGFDPDIVRVLLYRKEYFGTLFNEGFYDTLRADSEWSVGERELMAAFVSKKNHCRYCTDVHRATAARYLGKDAVDAALDVTEAAVSPKLAAVLHFLEKLTATPRDLVPADVAALRREGVTDAGIRDAAAICAQFCIINRLADTFGFRLETEKQLANHSKTLSTRNYRF